jgi:subtilisin family serine protease
LLIIGARRLRAARARTIARQAAFLSAALATTLATLADSAPLPPSLSSRLDPRLLAAAMAGDAQPVPVWVSFADKGERDPGDLATRLAAAGSALTPRALARRMRAHVVPLVDYRDLPVEPAYLATLRERGFEVIASSRWLNRVAVRAPATRFAEIAQLPFVDRIVPVERMQRSADPAGGGELPVAAPPPPSAPARARWAAGPPPIDYGRSLHMIRQLGVPAVHDSGYIGTGVLVCILDDGFKGYNTHEALMNAVVPPGMKRDFVDGDTIVTNPESVGHGTWVMGCIAGNKPGSYVGSGFGATFALARTEVDATETPVEMLYWGMGAEWADSLGADLITSSLGYSTFDNPSDSYAYAAMDGHTTTVTRAAEIAASKGILVVNAVGNEGNNSWHYLIAPSDVHTDSLIAVGAVDVNGNPAAFSSYGPNASGCIKPDLAARGTNDTLVSNSNPLGYTTLSGTSFSTPLLAGLATCMLQARPTWTPSMISRALRETASHAANPDNRVGWGIPNGLAALRWDPAVAGIAPPLPRFGLRLLGPNPLHASGAPLRIQFGLGDQNHALTTARVRVLDVTGREVRELYSGSLNCDECMAAVWDGRDRDGRIARPGVYLIALEALGHRSSARAILLP